MSLFMIPRAMNLMLEKNLTRLVGQLFAQIRKTGDLGIKPKFVSTRPSLTVALEIRGGVGNKKQ